MDFGSVLYTAHKNEKSANKEVKCYKTKFDPPKKEAKPAKPNLSANIQKYLQKREEEERRKIEEEKRKKEELLALRSQDKKAFKRVQTMLKRTKSANKSVMEDAIDEVNTVVTMAGPQQCDEDDYGYVSKEASDFYAKMMDKYANMPPEEPKFSQSKKAVPKDLNAAKDRVRAALQRAEEEEMMPHKRKRKSKSDQNDEVNCEEEDEERRKSRDPSPVEEQKPKKPKKMAPPPMDFSSLLKLAEQKQFEPIKIEKKVEDEERPMTKRQKIEYERELESRRRKEEREAMRIAALSKGSRSSDSGDKREKLNGLGRIPKKSNVSDSRPNQETLRRRSVDSEDDRMSNSNHSSYEKQKSKDSSDIAKPRNHYDGIDRKKETSILKSSLLKTDDRKPLKPTQPSISSNKIKSRKHSISDNEQSEESDSGYEKSRYPIGEFREHKSKHSSSSKDHPRKFSTGSDQAYSERNGSEKRSNMDNECTDSQSSSDSRKFQPSKSQSRSEPNSHKYKPQVKYKPDLIENKPEKYKPSYPGKLPHKKPSNYSSGRDRSYSPEIENKPEKYKPSYPGKLPHKKPNNYSSGRERSYSPENSGYSSERNHNRKQSCSESENENEYRPTKKGGSYQDRGVESDERSRSPDYTNHHKRRKDSYSEQESDQGSRHEPPRKKPSLNKVKKISSLFEGSDGEQSSYHDNPQRHKEIENKRPKSSHESSRQKDGDIQRSKPSMDSDRQKSSSGSKLKIPKSSKPDSEKPKNSENDKYKSLDNQKYASSSSKPLSKDVHKSQSERSKPERASTNSKPDGDRSRYSSEKSNIKSRPAMEPTKTDSKDSIKKPPSQNAEEVLKKSASVWSKPCNLSSTNSSTPRPPGGLSESQLQRLREMNKKPTPSKPPEDRYRSGPSENRSSLTGRPSPRDERKSDGRPAPSKPPLGLQSKQSLLMKAAADRGVSIKAQMASSRPSEHKPASKPSTSSTRDPTVRPKVGEMKPKQFPPSDLKPKQFPPSDLKPRQFPPKDVRPRQFPPPDVKRKPKPRRIIEDDSEEEYDSDMDSFIDDTTDLRPEDISREIQQIFGYDKSRYAGVDDEDDECMESNFGQIDREELRSLQIGAKEDYEELMRDLARKKRAKQKKQMEKGRR